MLICNEDLMVILGCCYSDLMVKSGSRGLDPPLVVPEWIVSRPKVFLYSTN
jgi:hypothetical protein